MKKPSKLLGILRSIGILLLIVVVLVSHLDLGILLSGRSHLISTWRCIAFLVVFGGNGIAVGIIAAKKCRSIRVLSWILVGLYCMIMLTFYSFRDVYSTDPEHYLEGDGYFYEVAPDIMPALDELSDYSNIDCINFYGKSGFWEPRCYLYLRVTYQPDVLGQKIDAIMEQYPMMNCSDDIQFESPFQIGNETYWIIDLSQRVNSVDLRKTKPEYNAVVGINEEEHYIVYFFFTEGFEARVSARTEYALEILDAHELLP